MIQNKKGISDVITTVLIILLVLAAVVIIWGFISGQINKTTDQVELRQTCLQVSIEPISCVRSDDGTGQIAFDTSFKLEGALSDVDGVKSNLIGAGGSNTVNAGASTTLIRTAVHSFGGGAGTISLPAKVSGSVVIDDGKGGEFICPPSIEIDCVVSS